MTIRKRLILLSIPARWKLGADRMWRACANTHRRLLAARRHALTGFYPDRAIPPGALHCPEHNAIPTQDEPKPDRTHRPMACNLLLIAFRRFWRQTEIQKAGGDNA
jgi:hypothetical protein